MKTQTPEQLKSIHTLFSIAGIKEKEDKQSVISAYTNKRTSSSKEMSFEESAALIGHLKTFDVKDKKADKMRKKIISMAHEMNWRKEGTKQIDMSRINNWCKKFGSLHKTLDSHTYEELPALVTQFEKLYKDYINKL